MRSARLEDKLQRAVCDLLDLYVAQRKLRYFAVPNGGFRAKIEAAIMKSLGVKAGVPDLVILLASGKTILMELKIGKNKPTPAQSEWHAWLNAHGFPCAVIYDVQAAYDFLWEHIST